MKLRDLSGDRFGRLLVVEQAEKMGNNTAWKCLCDCGNEKIVRTKNLVSGSTKSCGCYHKDSAKEKNTQHGASGTRLRNIWCGMIARCKYPSHNRYKYYGGKGISVCDEWKNYKQFQDWAFCNGYCENLTIDRIDNNGDYCPQNCAWVTLEENNRRAAQKHIITVNGESLNTTQWDKRIGVFSGCVSQWIRRYGEQYAKQRIGEYL